EGPRQVIRRESEDDRQMEETLFGWRSTHGTEGAEIDRFVGGRRSDHRRLPTSHTVAARRLPLRLAGDHSASHAFVATSLSSAPRNFATAKGRRRDRRQAKVQGLSDRLFPYRYRRGAHSRRQALSIRGDRSDVKVRLNRAA